MNAASVPNPGEGREPPAREVPAELEPHIRALVEDYLERRQAGEEPDPYALMLLHIPFAQEVDQRLETVEMLYRLAANPQEAADADTSLSARTLPVPHSQGSPGSTEANGQTPAVLGRYRLEKELGVGA